MKLQSEIKISVIVPVFCAESRLPLCIESLINQSLRNIEIILVDDGSTDSSGEICDSYAKKDSRITVIHKQNGGVSSARNRGLEIAVGDFVGFVDADDTVMPDTYEYLLKKAESYGADIVQCGMFFDTDEKSFALPSPKSDTVLYSAESVNKDFFKFFSGSSCSKLYKRETVEGIRYDESLTIGEDMRFNLDALVRSKCTVLASEPRYRYFQRADSACNSTPTREKLTSYSRMLKQAMKDFSAFDTVVDFLRIEALKNALDVCSKSVRFGNGEFDDLFSDARNDIIEIKKTTKTDAFSAKDKFKMWLVAHYPRIYKFLIGKIKR